MAERRAVLRRTARGAARGFSLLELTIVVAVVGILASIAIPGYRRLTCKAKRTEVFQVTAAIRNGLLAWEKEHERALNVDNAYFGRLDCSGRVTLTNGAPDLAPRGKNPRYEYWWFAGPSYGGARTLAIGCADEMPGDTIDEYANGYLNIAIPQYCDVL